jgi:hypothetical protein
MVLGEEHPMSKRIDMAKRVADLACDIDCMKDQLPTPLKEAAIAFVDEAHDMAELLAGEHVGKVYADPDKGRRNS